MKTTIQACRKQLRMFGAAALLVLGLTGTANATHFTAGTVDEIEGFGPGVFANSFFDPDTADWFAFMATGATTVTVETTAATFDTYLTLYSVAGIPSAGDLRSTYTLVARDDDGGAGLLSLINRTIAPGNYIVAVEQFGGGGGTYTVSISGDDLASLESVPEPTSMLLLGTALTGIAVIRRRRQ